MINKSKCKGINLGKQLIKNDSYYTKLIEISEKNHEFLKEDIKGPYRFGCI